MIAYLVVEFITHTRYGVPMGLSRKRRGKKEIPPTPFGPMASPRIKQQSFSRTTRGPFRLSRRSLTRREYPIPLPDPARGGGRGAGGENSPPDCRGAPLVPDAPWNFSTEFFNRRLGFPPGEGNFVLILGLCCVMYTVDNIGHGLHKGNRH